jgi:hypothetical protein
MPIQLESMTKILIFVCFAIVTCHGSVCAQSISEMMLLNKAAGVNIAQDPATYILVIIPNLTSSSATVNVFPDQNTAVKYSLPNNLGSYEITTTATYDTTGYYAPVTTTVADPTKGIKVQIGVPSVNDEDTFNALVIAHGEDSNGDGVIEAVPYNGTADPLKVTYHDFKSRTVWVYVPHLSLFIVTKGAADQINDTISTVKGFNLKNRITNSLEAKLQNAQDALTAANSGYRRSAFSSIDAFTNEVQAQTNKALSSSQASRLIAAASGIRILLGFQ